MSDTDKPLKRDEDGRGAGRAWPLFIGLPLILAVAVAAIIFSGGERSQPSGQGQPPQRAQEEQPAGGGREEASRGSATLGNPSLGREDAPVVMVEYGDYQ